MSSVMLGANSYPKVRLNRSEAWLLSANSRFWGIKRAASRMSSATALIKNRLCCTSTLHFPELLRSPPALTHRQGTSSGGFLSATLWQAALNSLRLCLLVSPHIYETNNSPQLHWHLQFSLSGSIMLSHDKWGNPKTKPSNEVKRMRRFSWGLFLRTWEKQTARLTERWRLVIHVNEMYQGREICWARSETSQAMHANLIFLLK